MPFQEAKCPRVAKRLMSATSPIRRAAPEGPMPLRSCRLLPVVSTSSVSSLSAALRLVLHPVALPEQLVDQQLVKRGKVVRIPAAA